MVFTIGAAVVLAPAKRTRCSEALAAGNERTRVDAICSSSRTLFNNLSASKLEELIKHK